MIKHENINKMNKNYRNPNIDLIRTLGMLAIMIDHLLYHGGGFGKFKFIELQLLNILCMWHVCSFGIISGLVGNKTHKFSNLLYLWILVVFYSFIFFIRYNPYKTFMKFSIIINNLLPVLTGKYWYFRCYFGIYPFLPFINEGISRLNRIQIKKSIYFMFGIFIIWIQYYKDYFQQCNGRSPISLEIFYIFGAYIGKYVFYMKISIYYRFLICIICLFIFINISIFCYNINIKNSYPKIDPGIKRIFRIQINSFPMVIQTLSITLFVAQISFNKYISKFITFIGPLTFDVYLIHENSFVRRNYIKNALNNSIKNITIINAFFFIFAKAIYIFFLCILLAYIRNIIFRILKIKNICVNTELII